MCLENEIQFQFQPQRRCEDEGFVL